MHGRKLNRLTRFGRHVLTSVVSDTKKLFHDSLISKNERELRYTLHVISMKQECVMLFVTPCKMSTLPLLEKSKFRYFHVTPAVLRTFHIKNKNSSGPNTHAEQ